ncbi:MAG TPA: DUF2760 domain-containing protein [Kofleriaceae bacterium]|nr:DUF2760 domain-containing protein [Kofleriaceae bacterium]
MHPWLAFLCFWKVLFGKKLPADLFEPVAPALPAPKPEPERAREREPEPRPADKPKPSAAAQHREGALALLAILQREARFVDFVRDSVDGASDADIGAVAREIHRGCRKVIDQYLTMEPVMPGDEGTAVTVPKGFDPAEVRLSGEAKGEAPYRGTLRHHGWRVVDAKLPVLADGVDRTVIAPAEVEL